MEFLGRRHAVEIGQLSTTHMTVLPASRKVWPGARNDRRWAMMCDLLPVRADKAQTTQGFSWSIAAGCDLISPT
jgi:hypothetical protein